MEIKLNDLEMLTILQALEGLNDQAKENRYIIYDSQQDFLTDYNNTRSLHNKLLMKAQNEGYLEDIQLI